MALQTEHPILLFDGVCNFCNAWVDIVLKHDRDKQFRFAALQSPSGQTLLNKHALAPNRLDTVVLIEGNTPYTKSTAALRVARRMRGLWPLLYGLIFVPRPIRDAVYDWIARSRYRWFGKQDACRVPSPEERDRFLD